MVPDSVYSIVFVHGFSGATLHDEENKMLWPNPFRCLLNRLFGTHIITEDVSRELLMQNITPGELIEDIKLWGIALKSVYKPIVTVLNDLKTKLNVQLNPEGAPVSYVTFDKFVYNWTKGVLVAANALHRFLEDIRERNLDKSGKGTKFILVAHSFGGLVCHYFIKCINNSLFMVKMDVLENISIATPHAGIPEIVFELLDENKIRSLFVAQTPDSLKVWSLDTFNVLYSRWKRQTIFETTDVRRRIFSTFQSIYDLLPLHMLEIIDGDEHIKTHSNRIFFQRAKILVGRLTPKHYVGEDTPETNTLLMNISSRGSVRDRDIGNFQHGCYVCKTTLVNNIMDPDIADSEYMCTGDGTVNNTASYFGVRHVKRSNGKCDRNKVENVHLNIFNDVFVMRSLRKKIHRAITEDVLGEERSIKSKADAGLRFIKNICRGTPELFSVAVNDKHLPLKVHGHRYYDDSVEDGGIETVNAILRPSPTTGYSLLQLNKSSRGGNGRRSQTETLYKTRKEVFFINPVKCNRRLCGPKHSNIAYV